ncbi:hypothetical protein [Methylobacterium thuringiense]|uniref:Integrase n=1 Tax=Methylobacterium thuringiense TaxID=1003091 RepID=A0ABQ4TSQ6_9HYPH|nr:hypothetical protein [Methylobacterium thuringiense]GJE57752.1 hypothetical protein EKPJFOCH_4270 [Methylobacterium thuringiense]
MSLDALRRRLDRIEARQGAGHITSLCNLAGHPAPIAAEAVRDWRAWVADGRASRNGDTLILRAPVLTAEQWSAAHEPRSGSLQ